jgi:Mrp family chromosome partitioning ATPase
VILIEADIRQPSVGRALGLESEFGLTRLLRGEVTLEEAMVETGEGGANLRVLLARGSGDPDVFGGDELLLPAASRLLSSAQRLADYVVIDSPPLAEVVDALELARRADAVLLVARLGQTQMTRLRRLGALLARTGVEPVGIVLVGTAHPRASDNYGYFGAGAVGYPAGASTARAGRSRGTVHTTSH